MTTDDDRFRAYVEERRGELVRTAVLLAAGDRWAAEDLVQTTLTRLYVAWSRVRPEAIDAYARRALLNALIDHRRLATTRREQVATELPETAVNDPAPDDTRPAVFAALAQLPPRMRAAVVMRHLLDLTVEETAAAMGCRQGTVKSQTARGLEQLRAALAAEGIAVDEPASAEASNGLAAGPPPPVPAPRSAGNHVPSNL
jgi:RNA polymerase sigma-70 factor (sigma-E family)